MQGRGKVVGGSALVRKGASLPLERDREVDMAVKVYPAQEPLSWQAFPRGCEPRGDLLALGTEGKTLGAGAQAP